MSRVCLEFGHRVEGRMTYGRKNEEYLADFYLISRRSLNKTEYDVFRYHFLLGADWKLCCWRLKMDRGTFFHTIYRIEQRLGRIFRELEPYGLYPLDEYFHGVIRKALPGQRETGAEPPVVPISLPARRDAASPAAA
jgi:hypothetical protein